MSDHSNTQSTPNIISTDDFEGNNIAQEILADLQIALILLGHSGNIRKDSRLAMAFISGKLSQSWTVERVAAEIHKNTLLYEKTLFSKTSHDMVELMALDLSKSTGKPLLETRKWVVGAIMPTVRQSYQQFMHNQTK